MTTSTAVKTKEKGSLRWFNDKPSDKINGDLNIALVEVLKK